MYSTGVPLNDIECCGDWSSMVVLLYLCTPFNRKVELESSIGQILSNLKIRRLVLQKKVILLLVVGGPFAAQAYDGLMCRDICIFQ